MNPTNEISARFFGVAKAASLRRRITLKAMIEHALKREIAFEEKLSNHAFIEKTAYRPSFLKGRATDLGNGEMVSQMMEEG